MTYKTIRHDSEFHLVEKKSEFIGYASPVSSETEAIAFVNAIRKKHSDARHNVFAYVLREGNCTRFSDDGEPHGTAGMPVLDSIRKSGLTDCVVVVTRYFGGILLGTGGLVRAYTSAASGALNDAEVAEVGTFSLIELKSSYADYQKLMPLVSSFEAKVESSDFGTDVYMTVSVISDRESDFASAVTESTNARVDAKKTGEKSDFI